MDKKLAMYIIVNEDIKMGKGKVAGQVGHAVNIWQYNNNKTAVGRLLIEEYMRGSVTKIVLKAPHTILESMEENYLSIRDNGTTQIEPNSLTCVNAGILDMNNIPPELQFIKSLKLL